VAFASTAGGTIVIGVENGTRRVRGLADPVLVAEQAANLISTLAVPRVAPEIEVYPWRKTHLVTITVHPAWTAPHPFTRLGPKDGVFVRVGASNRAADAPLVAQIERLARNEAYDEQPMPDCGADGIDVGAATELFDTVIWSLWVTFRRRPSVASRSDRPPTSGFQTSVIGHHVSGGADSIGIPAARF
jgi:predicted HTH transcriptional regulator